MCRRFIFFFISCALDQQYSMRQLVTSTTELNVTLTCVVNCTSCHFLSLPAVDYAMASLIAFVIYGTVRLVLLVFCMTYMSKHTKQNPVCTNVAGWFLHKISQKKKLSLKKKPKKQKNMGLCCT